MHITLFCSPIKVSTISINTSYYPIHSCRNECINEIHLLIQISNIHIQFRRLVLWFVKLLFLIRQTILRATSLRNKRNIYIILIRLTLKIQQETKPSDNISYFKPLITARGIQTPKKRTCVTWVDLCIFVNTLMMFRNAKHINHPISTFCFISFCFTSHICLRPSFSSHCMCVCFRHHPLGNHLIWCSCFCANTCECVCRIAESFICCD